MAAAFREFLQPILTVRERLDTAEHLTLKVMESDEWVLAAEFYSAAQAKAAHALLKSAVIPSFLKGNITAIQLMAPSSFLEQVHELLDSQISEEDLIAQAEAGALPESVAGEDAEDDPLGEKR
jgi:hypothetical protein